MKKTQAKTNLKNNEKGITLIALVITIIVLLILAGVAISMLSGENGILKQAANAKEKTVEATQDEEEKLSVIEGEIEFNYSGKNLGDYLYGNGCITGVGKNATAETLIAAIGDEYDLYTTDGVKITDMNTIIGTGTIIKKGNAELARVVRYGDVDGNNVVNSTDSAWVSDEIRWK